MVYSISVHFIAEGVTGFVEASQPFFVIVRESIVTIQIDVAPYPYMFDPDELGDMVVMVEHVFYCSWFLGRDEITDACDTHDASFGRHLADRFIGFASWLVGIKRATIGVRDEHGRLGNFKCIKRSAVAAMSDVDGHAHLIHPFDDRNAEITNPIVASLCASVADQVGAVVGQQRYTLPELIETINVIRSPKMLGVLQPQNNSDLAGTLRSVDSCCVVHAEEML